MARSSFLVSPRQGAPIELCELVLPCLHGGSLGSSVDELQGAALACGRRPAARKFLGAVFGAKAAVSGQPDGVNGGAREGARAAAGRFLA